MEKWEIEKNRLDLIYQKELQTYQVLLATKWGLPAAVLGAFFSAGLTSTLFLLGAVLAFLAYYLFSEKLLSVEDSLERIRQRIAEINV